MNDDRPTVVADYSVYFKNRANVFFWLIPKAGNAKGEVSLYH